MCSQQTNLFSDTEMFDTVYPDIDPGVHFVARQQEDTHLARITFADIEAPEVRPLANKIAKERGTVLDLYKVLLHSPPIASGWLRYLTAIRHECKLPGSIRELLIMRIAVLNGASYEAEQHAPIALREGLSAAQLNELPNWQESTLFDSRERAALAYTDAMTRAIRVPAPVFAQVRQEFDTRAVVELTATIAAYNMVSRFLEALEIHADPH